MWNLAQRVEPPALLAAWHEVTGSAPSDLTDTEWELLKPFIPAGSGRMRYGTRYIRHGTRGALNGILYQFQEGCPWSRVPIRYGAEWVVYQRHYFYKRKGVFARMLEGLQGKPEAARIVAWLRHEVSVSPSTHGSDTVTVGLIVVAHNSTDIVIAWDRPSRYIHGKSHVHTAGRGQERHSDQ